MKAKALYTILSAKFKEGKILFVSDLDMKAIKTKDAQTILSAMSKISGFKDLLAKQKNSAFVAIPAKNKNTEKSFANFSNLKMDEIRNVSPVDLMKYKYVVIANPEKGLPQITEKLAK